MPFYLSSRGYGVFFNTTFDTTFSFGNAGTYGFSANEHDAPAYARSSTISSSGRPGPPPGFSFRAADLTGVDNADAVPDWSNPATRAWLWNVFWTKALDPALGYPGDALWIDEPDEMGPIPYDAMAANGQRWAELRNAFFLYCQKAAGDINSTYDEMREQIRGIPPG